MFKDRPEPPPSTAAPGGGLNVLVELKVGAGDDPMTAARRLAEVAVDTGMAVDESFDPVPMAGGTAVVRCRVAGREAVAVLERQAEVAAVWPETPIAPMSRGGSDDPHAESGQTGVSGSSRRAAL
jgi:hypothetical protein